LKIFDSQTWQTFHFDLSHEPFAFDTTAVSKTIRTTLQSKTFDSNLILLEWFKLIASDNPKLPSSHVIALVHYVLKSQVEILASLNVLQETKCFELLQLLHNRQLDNKGVNMIRNFIFTHKFNTFTSDQIEDLQVKQKHGTLSNKLFNMSLPSVLPIEH